MDAAEEPRKGEYSKQFGRLINHSEKEPNVVANVVEVDNKPHMLFCNKENNCRGRTTI